MRKYIKLWIPIIVFLLVFTFSPLLNDSVQAQRYSQFKWIPIQQVEVTAHRLNVRTGPGLEYATIGHVKKGQIVDVLGALKEWYVVHLPDDSIGVISSKYTRVYRYHKTADKDVFTSTVEFSPKPDLTKTMPHVGSSEEQQMLMIINAAREKQGLNPFILDADLVKVAQLKAEDMVSNQYFSHQSPTYGSPFAMLKQFQIPYRSAGENIAGNTSIEIAHKAFMNSPNHRANILSKHFSKIGMGIIPDARYGKLIVQIFISE